MTVFISRYACAFADVVTQEKLDLAALDRQLDDFLATWEESPEWHEFLINPAIPTEQKVEILDKLNLRMGLQKVLRNLLAVLIAKGRISYVREIVAAYRAEMRERQGIRSVEIVTARELGAEHQAGLLAGVGKLAGGRIQARFTLDKSILGGTVVHIGSTVYDGSVRGRLERLKTALIS